LLSVWLQPHRVPRGLNSVVRSLEFSKNRPVRAFYKYFRIREPSGCYTLKK
jgi:hypothetical protein